ncbi:MAG TPA: iron-sulfur cluster assembly scaffold protein [Allosphingosinicella sp.]
MLKQVQHDGVGIGATPLYIAPVTTALYNRDILRLAASIPHQSRLGSPQATVEKRSPICGSRVTIDIALDETGRVAALGQEVKACALGQASASLMGAHALGRTSAELEAARDALSAFLAGTRGDPGDWPGLSIFAEARPFTARHRSILLAFEAAAEAAATAASVGAPKAATG